VGARRAGARQPQLGDPCAGIAPHKVADLIELLESQARDLDYQGRRGADYLRASEQHADESEEERDEAEAVL